MTTRRNLLTMMAAASAAAVAGCRMPAGDDRTASVGVPPNVVVGRTKDGLAVIREGKLSPVGAGAASLSGSTLAVAKGGSVALISTLSGVDMGTFALKGDWLPRAVSTPGSLIALTAPGTDSIHPTARTSTTIVFAKASGELYRHELAGVVEPDAFTSDETGLFVLEWLPASAPDHYRVRHLSIATGKLSPLVTRDKIPIPAGDEEEMRGEGRAGVPSPDRKVLYTLYTHQPGHQHTRDLISGRPNKDVHAFVHTLNLEQGWAYCVDLPAPFGDSDPGAYTYTLSGDGVWLYVADLALGKLAVISTEELKVNQVVSIPRMSGPAAAAGARDRVYIGADKQVTVLDRAGAVVTTWAIAKPLRGLATAPDQARVYLGSEGGLEWRDVEGSGSGRSALPGLLSVVRAL
jgi:hypothetical protein